MKHYRILHITILMITLSTLLFSAEKSKIYKKGEKYFFQKKFEMAELMFQQEIKSNPENFLAYSYLGDIFLRKKRYNGAINLYKKAIDLNPNIAENYFRIGQANYYKKLGNLAIENFKIAVEMDKKLKFTHYHIGLSYLMLKRDKKNTILQWEKYLRLAPEDPQYEKIYRVIQLLKDPNFKIPPRGSDITIEEALLLGGDTLKRTERNAKDKKASNEAKKTKNKIEDLNITDDDL